MISAPARGLYLVAYDIGEPRRLARVCRYMKGWKVGGQKSFCECWLTEGERTRLLRELLDLIDPETDRVHLLQLDSRMTPRCHGQAHSFQMPYFTIL
jgi:CRISPR-associated protein Cas2